MTKHIKISSKYYSLPITFSLLFSGLTIFFRYGKMIHQFKSMKIAFIGQKGIPTKQGGIEKHVQELSTRLAKADFDVTVYSRPYYTGSHRTKYGQIKIVNLPSLKTKNFDAISHTFLASIHAIFQNYDIIHYHGVGPSLMSWIPRLFNPCAKVIATFHCVDRKHQKWGLIARTMLGLGEWATCRFPHETIVVSETLKKYCEYRFDRQTTYIPNGVQINHSKQKSDIIANYGLKQDRYLLIVSRLVKHKGIHTLIEAYQKTKTNQKLVIVGTGSNTNNYIDYLKELAQGNENIIFTGQKSGNDLETLFRGAYAFVQPSEAEGLSIALLEAIAYGLPVIISNIEENIEAANGFGIVFENRNINDLSNKITWVIKNKALIKKQARVAKNKINQKYNWTDIASQTSELYQNIVAENRNRKYLPKIILK